MRSKKDTPDDGSSRVREIRSDVELLSAVSAGNVVLYKHSHRCGLCRRSLREIEAFADAHPDVPVLQIDVVRRRTLSNQIAKQFGIKHESPQAILVREGEAAWHGSHRAVTAEGLEGAL